MQKCRRFSGFILGMLFVLGCGNLMGGRNGRRSFLSKIREIFFESEEKHKLGKTFIKAARDGKYDEVKEILKKDPGIIFFKDSSYKGIALHWAVERGHINIIKLLLDKQINVNEETIYGETSIIVAIKATAEIPTRFYDEEKCIKIVNLFLEKGAEIDHQNKDGNTAFGLAVRLNRPKLCFFLLEKEAKIDISNKKGWFSVDFAQDDDLREILEKYFFQNASWLNIKKRDIKNLCCKQYKHKSK